MAIRKRPFGYEMCRGQIQSCPAEEEVVRMLHEQYANGLSYRQLTAILNAGTVPYNEPDKPWNKNMVARILGNDIYIGNKGYPPILEESLLRKVQAMKPDAGQTADTRAKMLRAMCRCASCGRKPAMNANAKGWQRWNCPECGALTSKATLQSVTEDLETILSELRVDSGCIEAKPTNGCSNRIADLEQELAEAMEKETFDDIQGRAIAMELASARFEMLGNEEYESYRIRHHVSAEESGEIEVMLPQIATAILIPISGDIKLLLKNGQTVERSVEGCR